MQAIAATKVFSQRLILRRIEPTDLELLAAWSQSEDAHGPYLTPDNCTVDQCRDRLDDGFFWNERSRTYVITTREGAPLGTIHFWTRANDFSTAVMAVKIADPQYRGHGLGTEAQKALTIHMFSRGGNRYSAIEMYTDLDNRAEQRCLAKLGFDFVESLSYDDHGHHRVGNLYRLTKARYESFLEYRLEDGLSGNHP